MTGIYSFSSICEEDHSIILEDGAKRVMVNAGGSIQEEQIKTGNPALFELFHYLQKGMQQGMKEGLQLANQRAIDNLITIGADPGKILSMYPEEREYILAKTKGGGCCCCRYGRELDYTRRQA